METLNKIRVERKIKISKKDLWTLINTPSHFERWCKIDEEWITKNGKIDFKIGGSFRVTFESPDGAFSKEFYGVYTEIIPFEKIAYKIDNNRLVEIYFEEENGFTQIVEIIEAENKNSFEIQEKTWDSMLEKIKQYAES